jgi:hypothetical protein
MLMSAHNRTIDHGIFVVGGLGQMLKDLLPNTGFGPVAEATVGVVPVAKVLR